MTAMLSVSGKRFDGVIFFFLSLRFIGVCVGSFWVLVWGRFQYTAAITLSLLFFVNTAR
jgi:hypothetical protein